MYLTSFSALRSDHLPVLIETACRSYFHHPWDRHDFKRNDWANVQTQMEQLIQFDSELHNEMAISTCVENFSGTVRKALAASTPERRPRNDPRPPIPAGIQDETRPKNRLRRPGTLLWKPRSTDCRGRWPAGWISGETIGGALRSNPSILKTNRFGGSPSGSSPHPGHRMGNRSLRLWESRSPCRQSGGSVSAGDRSFGPDSYKRVDVTLRSYFLSPANEPQLTTPEEVHEAFRSIKVSKTPSPNGIPKKALRRLPKRAVSLLARVFNAVLRTHHYPQTWKHARVIPILNAGKNPALPSFYWPISLLETTGKLFEKIILARILYVVNERGLMRDEQFGFRPRHSTSLQLARLVERITRNFGEKRLTGAVFLDVAKAFDTVWINGLLYKLTLLNLPSYNLILPQDRTFEASFQTATSSRRGMQAGVAQGGLISPVLFSLYVNDMPPPSHNIELALYADDTVILATSH